MKRERSVTVRLTEEEQARLARMAKERDVPMSIVLRQLLRQEDGLPTQVKSDSTQPKRKS